MNDTQPPVMIEDPTGQPETQPAAETNGALAAGVQSALERLDALNADLARLAEVADMTARQVAFIPPQVRTLTGKLDGVVSAIGESRYQALLLRLLSLYDLTLQMTPPVEDADGFHRFDVLLTQMRQILAVNGLSEIDASGAFDPAQHRSLGRVAVDDPALDGRIVEVLRPGFRSDATILRYAEVRVGAFSPPEIGVDSENTVAL